MEETLLPWSVGQSNNHFVFYLTGGLGLIYFMCLAVANALARREPSVIVLSVAEEEVDEDFYEYLVTIKTSIFPGSSCPSDVRVFLQLCGESHDSPYYFLKSNRMDRKIFKRACSDIFLVRTKVSLGQVHLVKFILAGRRDVSWKLWEVEVYQPGVGDRVTVPVQFSNMEDIENCEETPILYLKKSLIRVMLADVLMYHRCLSPFNNPTHFGAFTPTINVLFLFLTLTTVLDGSLIAYIMTASSGTEIESPETEESAAFDVFYRVLFDFTAVVVGTLFVSFLEFIIRNTRLGKKTPPSKLVPKYADVLNIETDIVKNVHKCVETESDDQAGYPCRYFTCVENRSNITNQSPLLDVKLHLSLAKQHGERLLTSPLGYPISSSTYICRNGLDTDSITLTLRDGVSSPTKSVPFQPGSPADAIMNAYNGGGRLLEHEADVHSVQMEMLLDPFSHSLQEGNLDADNMRMKMSRKVQSAPSQCLSKKQSFTRNRFPQQPRGVESVDEVKVKPPFPTKTFSVDKEISQNHSLSFIRPNRTPSLKKNSSLQRPQGVESLDFFHRNRWMCQDTFSEKWNFQESSGQELTQCQGMPVKCHRIPDNARASRCKDFHPLGKNKNALGSSDESIASQCTDRAKGDKLSEFADLSQSQNSFKKYQSESDPSIQFQGAVNQLAKQTCNTGKQPSSSNPPAFSSEDLLYHPLMNRYSETEKSIAELDKSGLSHQRSTRKPSTSKHSYSLDETESDYSRQQHVSHCLSENLDFSFQDPYGVSLKSYREKVKRGAGHQHAVFPAEEKSNSRYCSSLDEIDYSHKQRVARCLSEDLDFHFQDPYGVSFKTHETKSATPYGQKKTQTVMNNSGSYTHSETQKKSAALDLAGCESPNRSPRQFMKERDALILNDYIDGARFPKLHLSDTSLLPKHAADTTSYYSLDGQIDQFNKPQMTTILEGYEVSWRNSTMGEVASSIVSSCILSASKILHQKLADHILELKGMAYKLVFEAAKMIKTVRDKISRGSVMCLEDVLTKVRELNCDVVRHIWLHVIHKQHQLRLVENHSETGKTSINISEPKELKVTYEQIFPKMYQNSIDIIKSVVTELIQHMNSCHKITGAVIEIIAHKVLRMIDVKAATFLDENSRPAQSTITDDKIDSMDVTVLSEVVIRNTVSLILKKYQAACEGQYFNTLMESLSTSILTSGEIGLHREAQGYVLVWNMCHEIINDAKRELWQEYQDPFHIYTYLLARQTMLERLKSHRTQTAFSKLTKVSPQCQTDLIQSLSLCWHKQGFHSSVKLKAEIALAQVLVCWFVSERRDMCKKYPLWHGQYMKKMEQILAVKLKRNTEMFVTESLLHMLEGCLYPSAPSIGLLEEEINVQVELIVLRLESSSEVLVEEVLQEEEVNYLASRLVTKVVSDALCRHQSDNCKVTYQATDDVLDKADIAELKKDFTSICGYLKFIQFSDKNRAKETAEEYFEKSKSRHKQYAMISLQNTVDSYYIVDKLDDGHLSKSVLFQYEFEATQESCKLLSPSNKSLVCLISICFTVFSFVYVSVVGGQLDTDQVTEWFGNLMITIIEFLVLLEPLKAVLIGWYEYERKHTHNTPRVIL